MIVAVAAVAGLAGAAAPGVPAGWPVADALLAGGFAALTALATSRSRRWTWVWIAGIASVSATGWALVPAILALGLSSVSAVIDKRSRVIGAMVGALAVQALLRLEVGAGGASAAIVILAVTPTLFSAYIQAPRRVRSRVHWGVVVVALIFGLGAAALAVASVGARGRVEAGIDHVITGLEAARNGDTRIAAAEFSEAAEVFEAANDTLGAWWVAPARVTPVVGLHARALQDATSYGQEVAASAATVSEVVDIESFTWSEGRLDLDRVRAAADPLRGTAASMSEASDAIAALESPWLLSPVKNRLDAFGREIDQALPEAELAAELARLGPAILGGEGERRYLVVVTTPAEARGLGGFMGNWVELTAANGDIEVTDSGRAVDLNATPGIREVDPAAFTEDGSADPVLADYVRRYGGAPPWEAVQDITVSPDFPTVANVWRQVYPQTTGREIDGVIHVDPEALAALMEFSGPVSVDGIGEPLTSDTLVDFLLVDQYLLLDDRAARDEVLDEVTTAVFDQLTTGELPNPRKFADVLESVVAEGRLSLHSFDADEQALLEEADADNAMAEVGRHDSLAVVTQNGGQNKIDVYLERRVRYDVVLDRSSGEIEGTITIELTNAVPSLELPEPVIANNDQGFDLGTNETIVSVYTPHRFVSATLDDRPVGVGADTEFDRRVYTRRVLLAPGQSAVLELQVSGKVRLGGGYQLEYVTQPLVNTDALDVEVTPVGGRFGSVGEGLQVTAEGFRATYGGLPRVDTTLEIDWE